MRSPHVFSVHTTTQDADENLVLIDALVQITPGYEGMRFDRRGDPGLPPEPAEIVILTAVGKYADGTSAMPLDQYDREHIKDLAWAQYQNRK